MRIGFYAPMKAPTHPTPSGDRQVARLLMRALDEVGHEVVLASDLRSWQSQPDDARLDALQQDATEEIDRLTAPSAPRPDLFLTYHLYHKAPDLIGPMVADKLDIPYVIIEASHAEHRRGGPWDAGLRLAEGALRKADAVVALHQRDRAGLAAEVPGARLFDLAPFIDAAPFAEVQSGPPSGPTRLLTVAMMRSGDKLTSYHVLADALSRLVDLDWTLTIVGDGPERQTIDALFPSDRTRFAGALPASDLPDVYAAADLFVWPAWKEAFGLVFLEAMASGLPVVGGRNGGVPDIVVDGLTGLLPPPDDAEAQAQAIRRLIENPAERQHMGKAARNHVLAHHDLATAKQTLAVILRAARHHHMERTS